MTINISLPNEPDLKPRITVIGVGVAAENLTNVCKWPEEFAGLFGGLPPPHFALGLGAEPANCVGAKALGKCVSGRAAELGGVLSEIAHRVAGLLELGQAMRPPAAPINVRNIEAARNPNQEVIVGAKGLSEFENPQVTEHLTVTPDTGSDSSIEVAPDALKKLANVARARAASRSVGEREHVPRATVPTLFRLLVMESRPGDDGFLEPLSPDRIPV